MRPSIFEMSSGLLSIYRGRADPLAAFCHRGARLESRQLRGCDVALLLAGRANNHRTNCETNRSVRSPAPATRSNQDISFLRRNSKAVRETRAGARDASAKNGLARLGSPFGDCRKRLLRPKTHLDTTHA